GATFRIFIHFSLWRCGTRLQRRWAVHKIVCWECETVTGRIRKWESGTPPQQSTEPPGSENLVNRRIHAGTEQTATPNRNVQHKIRVNLMPDIEVGKTQGLPG